MWSVREVSSMPAELAPQSEHTAAPPLLPRQDLRVHAAVQASSTCITPVVRALSRRWPMVRLMFSTPISRRIEMPRFAMAAMMRGSAPVPVRTRLVSSPSATTHSVFQRTQTDRVRGFRPAACESYGTATPWTASSCGSRSGSGVPTAHCGCGRRTRAAARRRSRPRGPT